MISELELKPIINGYNQIIGEKMPTNQEVLDKINEIIRYINETEKER